MQVIIDVISEKQILKNKLTKPYSKYVIALKEVAIDINDINIGKKLGNGHFAAVYEGECRVSITEREHELSP